MNKLPKLQRGDILLYNNGGIVAALICFRTWSDVDHVEVYAGDRTTLASRNGLGVNRYAFRERGLRYVLRPIPKLDWQAGFDWFCTVRGTPYGWGDLGRFYLLDIPTKGLICSQFGDEFFFRCGLPLFNRNYPSGAVCPRDFQTISSLLVRQIHQPATPKKI